MTVTVKLCGGGGGFIGVEPPPPHPTKTMARTPDRNAKRNFGFAKSRLNPAPRRKSAKSPASGTTPAGKRCALGLPRCSGSHRNEDDPGPTVTVTLVVPFAARLAGLGATLQGAPGSVVVQARLTEPAKPLTEERAKV